MLLSFFPALTRALLFSPIVLIGFESHLVRLPSFHSPCIFVPFFGSNYTPKPCCKSFFHGPVYLRPFGQIMVPFPSFLPS